MFMGNIICMTACSTGFMYSLGQSCEHVMILDTYFRSEIIFGGKNSF